MHLPGLSDSIAAVNGAEDKCLHCGATIRVGNGLCVSCSLGASLEDDAEASLESFEALLDTAEIHDTQWRVGNYEILEEIGRGGMGVIYRARQRHSRRIVALKRMVSQEACSAETLERFRREAEAAASLDNPNILPIYEVGQGQDGVPFFSMKYAAGGSLQKASAALQRDPRECVRLVAKIARAMQYAHEHNILHRDLKPGNILLDGHGEPFVTDFGLAKWLDGNTDLTRTLTVFGTPGYIAPEQADGAAENLTPAADTYSLGAILFHLLTGRPPFIGENALEVIRRAAEKPAPKLRSLAPALDRDLETICGRCLDPEPRLRYRSAGELAIDLERWLEGRPILARPVLPPVRMWRWMKRNRKLAAAIAAAASSALVATFLFFSNDGAHLPPSAKSIAILPFENLSDAENIYFTQGMQDEILYDLAKVADLKVISRTSVMDYRPEKKRNLREIANGLHVAYVLEGSVARSADHVRVHTRLIDARTDSQVWAEQYNGNLADAFSIQGEIAMAIAQQLKARLSQTEQSAIRRHPTDDLVAFDLYSRAENLLMTRANKEIQLKQAVDLLTDAVGHDPNFFKAYCQLASTDDLLYFLGYDHTPARLAAAEAALAAALQLRPEAGEVHLARAQNLYQGYLDYDGALAELAIARQSLPNNSRVLELQGYVERRRNQWESSTKNIERALELDPHNYYTLQQLAISYGVLRRYPEEAAVLDRALAIAPNNTDIRVTRAFVDFHWKGDTRALHRTLADIRAASPGAVADIAGDWFSCAMAERDPVAAKAALDAMTSPLSDYKIHLSRPLLEGLLARMQNDSTKAKMSFAAARIEQEKVLQAQPNYGPPLSALSLIDAGLGRKEDALREAQHAIDLVSVEKDALAAPQMNAYAAMVAGWLGEKDLACRQLEIAVRPPSTISYGQLKLLPVWDPLRGDPCFERIVASLAPN